MKEIYTYNRRRREIYKNDELFLTLPPYCNAEKIINELNLLWNEKEGFRKEIEKLAEKRLFPKKGVYYSYAKTKEK